MIIGVVIQTVTLIILTARTNWDAEVINKITKTTLFFYLFRFKCMLRITLRWLKNLVGNEKG